MPELLDWFPVDVVQAGLEYVVPGLVLALFLGWIGGAVSLFGNVPRRN